MDANFDEVHVEAERILDDKDRAKVAELVLAGKRWSQQQDLINRQQDIVARQQDLLSQQEGEISRLEEDWNAMHKTYQDMKHTCDANMKEREAHQQELTKLKEQCAQEALKANAW